MPLICDKNGAMLPLICDKNGAMLPLIYDKNGAMLPLIYDKIRAMLPMISNKQSMFKRKILTHIAALPEINLKYCKRDASIIERI